MKNMRQLIIPLSILMVLTPTLDSLAGDKPQTDVAPPSFAQFNLKVTGAQVVQEISNPKYRQSTFKPKEGRKLLVVTLEGYSKKPTSIPYQADDFCLVYKVKETYGPAPSFFKLPGHALG